MKRSTEVPLYKLVPNMLTLLGLCLGITAVRYSFDGKWEVAVTLIIASAAIDGIDGRVARLLRASSSFGAHLDSLADVINFGMVPAINVYLWTLKDIPYKGVGWSIVLFYVLCAALRLARFNSDNISNNKAVETKKPGNYFVGLPVPMAAALSQLPLMLSFETSKFQIGYIGSSVLMIALGLIMVSRIKTFSGKNVSVHRYNVPIVMMLVGILFVGILFRPWVVLPALLTVYASSILIIAIRHRFSGSDT